MAKITRKRFSASFKFQIVLEILTKNALIAEVAKRYHVHPITLGQWRKEFLAHGERAFTAGDDSKEREQRIKELERLLGQKELEIALYKNFLDENSRPMRK